MKATKVDIPSESQVSATGGRRSSDNVSFVSEIKNARYYNPLDFDSTKGGDKRHETTINALAQYRPIWRRHLSSSISEHSLSKNSASYLHEAYRLIRSATDDNLLRSERSNLFDDWKDTLQLIAENCDDLTTKHRTILGALINATRDLDIANFSQDALNNLLENSNVLRQPKITKTEKIRAITSLSNLSIDIILSLNVSEDDSPNVEKLESMMAFLLIESQKAAK